MLSKARGAAPILTRMRAQVFPASCCYLSLLQTTNHCRSLSYAAHVAVCGGTFAPFHSFHSATALSRSLHYIHSFLYLAPQLGPIDIMARFFPRWMRAILAVLTALSTHMAHAALTPGEIADFSNELALDTFALKDLVNEIVADNNGGALQDVFEQYNHIIDTLGAQFQFLPGTPMLQDASAQTAVFEAYSNVRIVLYRSRVPFSEHC
jgi:hypothetical protein